LSEEKMDMAFRLEFCFFVSRQRKNKKRYIGAIGTTVFVEEPKSIRCLIFK
jgi:hypothetical protein